MARAWHLGTKHGVSCAPCDLASFLYLDCPRRSNKQRSSSTTLLQKSNALTHDWCHPEVESIHPDGDVSVAWEVNVSDLERGSFQFGALRIRNIREEWDGIVTLPASLVRAQRRTWH